MLNVKGRDILNNCKQKMNKNKFQKGFTLIELLVVIAIIGILASILLVNLATTRNKAKDAAIKLEMGQMRTAVENYNFDQSPNTYVGACIAPNGAECATLQADILSKGGTGLLEFYNTTAYCIQYDLNTGGGSWCVDSTGYAGSNAGCDGANYDCVP